MDQKSIRELLSDPIEDAAAWGLNSRPGAEQFETTVAVLHARSARESARAAEAGVKLVAVTSWLVFVTGLLAVATFALAVATFVGD